MAARLTQQLRHDFMKTDLKGNHARQLPPFQQRQYSPTQNYLRKFKQSSVAAAMQTPGTATYTQSNRTSKLDQHKRGKQVNRRISEAYKIDYELNTPQTSRRARAAPQLDLHVTMDSSRNSTRAHVINTAGSSIISGG